MKSNNALIVILGTVTLDAVGHIWLCRYCRASCGYRPFRQHRRTLWRAASAICVDAILCAPVLGALSDRLAAAQSCSLRYLSHYRLRDHGDHTRPVDIRI